MTIFDSNHPDFRNAKREADFLLLSTQSLEAFPYSIKSLVKEKTDLKMKTYSKAAMYGVEMEEFGSQDAILQKYSGSGRSIIFYNDEISVKERVKFSLAHELGHYVLKHDSSDHSNYSTQEIEANFFAAELLMPQPVIFELLRRGADITVANLVKWFGVSRQAAQKRFETLSKVNNDFRTEDEIEIDNLIVNKFIFFINSILPDQNYSNWYDEEESLQLERESWY